MASSAASSGPTLGQAWPCTSTRPSPHSSSTRSRAWAITSADSGSTSPTADSADSTARVVSLRSNSSSIQRSVVKQALGSDSPQSSAYGNRTPSPPPSNPGGYSSRWVWTSTTGWSLPSTSRAASASTVASSGTSNEPPGSPPPSPPPPPP